MPPQQDVCEVIINCLVEYEEPRNRLHKKENANLLECNSHMGDEIESRKIEDMKTHKEARLCLAASCKRTEANDTTQATIGNSYLSDSRDVTAEQLRAKVDENDNLSRSQKEQLYALLLRYTSHLTKRPSRCTQFKDKFQ
jgi:hypothetical protein